jgi:hypothetical protein
VEWLVVDLQDRKETEIFHLFPICNAFMLNSNKPQRVVLVAGVFGAGNASSAVLTAFIMAANKEPYNMASERIGKTAQKAMPHAQHFVEQLELLASLGSFHPPQFTYYQEPWSDISLLFADCRFASLGSMMGGHR